MPILFTAFLFVVFGLIFGSFGNATVIRLAKGETLGGRSHCPHCLHMLAWYDLLPILSFFMLRGKCRYCKKPIALQYLMMELTCAAVFLLAFASSPHNVATAATTAIVFFGLLLICLFDFHHQQIPDAFTAIVLVGAVASVALRGTADVPDALYGAAIGIVWFGFQWVISRGALVGSGDIWLAGAIGIWLGSGATVTMLMVSYIIGAIVASYLVLSKKMALKKSYLPFAPFMATGAVVAFIGFQNLPLALLVIAFLGMSNAYLALMIGE